MTYGFATQVCILDERGCVERFIAAHDVGKVVNRHMVEGQIEGAVHMGPSAMRSPRNCRS